MQLPMQAVPSKPLADPAPSTKESRSPERAQDASVATDPTELARPMVSHSPLTLPVARTGERAALGRTETADNGVAAKRICSHTSLTLPVASAAERACLGQVGLADSGTGASRSQSQSRSCPHGKSASPWSSALRQATPSAWSKGVRSKKDERHRIHAVVSPRHSPAFDFMAAARSTSPENWSQV